MITPVDPVEQFFSMFARANVQVWPMQVVWYAAAVAAIGLAVTHVRGSSRLIAGFLAVYYVWLAIVFFGIYYSPLNDHSFAFAAMFALGGCRAAIPRPFSGGALVYMMQPVQHWP